jgi:hypothetical protein
MHCRINTTKLRANEEPAAVTRHVLKHRLGVILAHVEGSLGRATVGKRSSRSASAQEATYHRAFETRDSRDSRIMVTRATSMH